MGFRRRTNDSLSMLRRAHLGSLTNAEEIIELAHSHGLRTMPLDVHGLLVTLNVEVVFSHDLDKTISGRLKLEDQRWVCTINAAHHPTRQRFTMAHELAHFLLHRDDKREFVDQAFFRSVDSLNKMELEANSFAAAVLMPESDFRQRLTGSPEAVDELAAYFGVSPPAVRVRARQLGYKV